MAFQHVALRLVAMPVVDIRVVGMGMIKCFMLMLVSMRLTAFPRKSMVVQMVHIMTMFVRMHHRRVDMAMPVALC